MKTTSWKYEDGKLKCDSITIDESSIIIKVLYSCICGTDIHNIEKFAREEVDGVYLGHEFIGEIINSDSKSKLKMGDKVIVNPGVNCGKCVYCKQGYDTYCLNRKTYGMSSSSDMLGGFSKFLKLNNDTKLHVLPPNVNLRNAVLIEPISVVLKALNILSNNTKISEKKIAIVGLGPIGIITNLLLKKFKPQKIVSFEIEKFRIDKSIEFFNIDAMEVSSAFFHEKNKFDIVIDCSGTVSGWNTCFDVIKKGGVLMEIGQFVSGNKLYFDPSVICKKDLKVLGSSLGDDIYYSDALSIINEFDNELNMLITHEFKFNELNDAFENAIEKTCFKVVINNEK